MRWRRAGETPEKLIVGLGNPGEEYANSLHNIGFMAVNYFARQHRIRFDRSQAEARTGIGKVGGIKVMVARPQTYMNRSGESVNRLVKKFRIELKDLLVIYDDMDLPLGKIRVRADGSAAGHNGMKSIIQDLGSQEFSRLRIGIGRPGTEGISEGNKPDVISYLLSELPLEAKTAIDQTFPKVSEAIFSIITEGVTAAMNKYN